MLTREELIAIAVDEKRMARDTAGRPFPWWEKHRLVGRNEIIAHRLEELAGQEAVILFAEGADAVNPIPPGPACVKVSRSAVSDCGTWGWASIDKIYHGFRLDRVGGVFSLAEAEECGVMA